MQKLTDEIKRFFLKQSYVIVSTIDQEGAVHNSCKGVVEVSGNGIIYLLDVYKAKTYMNLQDNQNISVTAVDEHKFKGYCLKGKAKIIPPQQFESKVISMWEARIASRITQRVIRNIAENKGHPRHPEALLPRPEYLIAVEVQDVINLTPKHMF